MNKKLHLIIHGRVQGVFFRSWVKKHAQIYNISGWVKNNRDRTVEVIAEGKEANLKQFIQTCNQGPLIARIDSIETDWEEYKNEFESFKITY